MDRDAQLRQYVLKKQQAREHAAYLRQQRANGGAEADAPRSSAHRRNFFAQKRRIVGDPFASTSTRAPSAAVAPSANPKKISQSLRNLKGKLKRQSHATRPSNHRNSNSTQPRNSFDAPSNHTNNANVNHHLGRKNDRFHLNSGKDNNENASSWNRSQPRFNHDDDKEQEEAVSSSAAVLIAKLEQQQNEGAIVEAQQVKLTKCQQCGRKFTEQALQRHIKICQRVFGQKRKQFNIAQQRASKDAWKATVGADHSRENDRTLANKKQQRKNKWKAQSSMLRDAVRQSRAIGKAMKEGKSLADIPSMPAMMDDRVPCPHCGRRFAEQTANRHIPKCRDIIAKPKALMRSSRR